MKDVMIHTPIGVRDILPEERAIQCELEQRIKRVFLSFGYREVQSPTFEHVEVLSGSGGMDTKKMYKFFDRDGSTLALRSDMTPAIARITASAYKEEVFPQRFCCFGNVFRYNENYQGKLRELPQAGVELIGAYGDEADGEIVALAIHSILATGVQDFRLELGHVAFLEGLIDEIGLAEDERKFFIQLLEDRDYIGVEEIIQQKNLSHDMKQLFLDLPQLVGDIGFLENTAAAITNPVSLKAIERLKGVYQVLKEYQVENYVYFDLGMLSKMEYYTGIILRGYTYGTGFSIVEGGRYDSFLGRFGCDRQAVGFAIKIHDLAGALKRQKNQPAVQFADTLLCFHPQGRRQAYRVGMELRKQGLYIENSLLGPSEEDNIQYARKKQFGGVLIFLNDTQVKMMDLVHQTESVVDIDQWLEGYSPADGKGGAQ